MSRPINLDIPHRLGAEEARRRIADNVGGLTSFIPGGADVRSSWAENVLTLNITAMGQQVDADVDVRENVVRVGLLLPPALSFFASTIEKALARRGAVMLEDKREG